MLTKLDPADIIQVLLLCVVIIQLLRSHMEFKADHERRKKQATFEFINSVSDRYQAALHKFDQKHGKGKVIDLSQYDEEDEYMVKSYLNEIERICAGVNADVFDYDILKKMMSTALCRRNERFRQYINEKQNKNPSLFCEYDYVVEKLKKDANKLQNIGVTKYS